MRKTFRFLMSVVAMTAVVGCTTDVTEDLSVKVGGKTQLTLSFDDTRTEIGAKDNGVYPLTWSENDQVSVNGVASDELTVAEGAGTANATFTFGGELKTPYCVAFPAAAAGQVMFAAVQNHTSNTTFDSKAAVMYGYSKNGENIKLKHLTGILKIGLSLESNAKIMTVRISTIDRKPIAGAFDLNFETGELTPVEGETSSVITYNLFDEEGDAGLDLSMCYDTPYIHVAVPAGVYDELYITLVDEKDYVMYKTVKAYYKDEDDDKSLKPGMVREFTNTIKYEAMDDVNTFVISDFSSLESFKNALEAAQAVLDKADASDDEKAAATATLSKNATVVNDISISKAEINDARGWGSINAANYTGTINGNGYQISGLPTPLFDKTAASFRGLHIAVNYTQTKKVNAGTFANVIEGLGETPATFEHCSASGTITISNNTTTTTTFAANSIGGFVGMASGVDFKDCVNNVDIVLDQISKEGQSSTMSMAAGGFAGYTNVSATKHFVQFYNCTNNGDITFNEGTETRVMGYIGGFVGSYRGAGSVAVFENAVNNGDFTIKANTRGCNIGGIIGYSNGSSTSPKTFTFKGNTVNNGTISMSGADISNYNRLGGICGYPTEYVNMTFEGEVVNNGNIVITGSSPGLRVGGIFGVPDNGSTVTFNSSVTNKGSISVSGKHTDNVYMTGISPYTTLKKCKLTFKGDVVNEGAMTFTGTTKDLWIAGLLGRSIEGITIVFEKKAINRATGDISVSGTVSSELFAGGLFSSIATGHAAEDDTSKVGTYSSITLKDEAVNYGSITIGGEYGDAYVGGVLGIVTVWSYMVAEVGITNSEEADITLSGTSKGLINCGGLVGKVGSDSKASYVTLKKNTNANKGDITLGMTCSGTDSRTIGGILGYGRNSNFNVYGNGLALNEGNIHVTKDATTSSRWNIGGIVGYYNGNNFRSGDYKAGALNKGNITFEGTANGNVYIGGIIADNYNSTTSIESFINIGNITVLAKLAEGKLLHVGGFQGTMYSSDRKFANTQVHCDIIACIDNGDGTYSPCSNVGMGTGDVITTTTSTDETTGETTTTTKTPVFTNVKLGGRIATAVTVGADGKVVGQFTDLTATNVFDYALGIRENRTEYAGVSFLESKDAIDYGTWGN